MDTSPGEKLASQAKALSEFINRSPEKAHMRKLIGSWEKLKAETGLDAVIIERGLGFTFLYRTLLREQEGMLQVIEYDLDKEPEGIQFRKGTELLLQLDSDQAIGRWIEAVDTWSPSNTLGRNRSLGGFDPHLITITQDIPSHVLRGAAKTIKSGMKYDTTLASIENKPELASSLESISELIQPDNLTERYKIDIVDADTTRYYLG